MERVPQLSICYRNPQLGEKPTNSLIDDAYSSIVLGSSLEVARRFKVLLLNFDDGIATGGTGLAD